MKSRTMRWVKHVARMLDMNSFYKMLVGKPERPAARRMHRRKVNIETDLKDEMDQGVKLTHVAQNRVQWRAVVDTTMNHQVP